MNENIMKLLMPKQYYLYCQGKCPICEKKIDYSAMTAVNMKEYNISGLCKECQDRIFN